jgi:anti-sigma B factor antagonist
MVLQISKRLVNATIILELKGRLTLGEESRLLRDTVLEVITFDKPSAVILDISGMRYIDSSGIGELVSAFTNVRNKLGSNLFLCHPLVKVKDLLQITKLITVFNIAVSVEEVLSGVPSKQVRFACPVYTCQAWSLVHQGSEYQACSRCNSRYRFKDGYIDHMLIDSYPGEVVSFNPFGVPTMTTSGPVDLFVTNMFERAWLTMDRRNRSAILDLTSARDVTERAVQELLRIVKTTEDGIGLIVLPASHSLSRLGDSAICAELAKARDVFGEGRWGGLRLSLL